MSKTILANAIREATGCTIAQAKDAVDGVTTAVQKNLKKDGKFALVGFGTFHVSKRGKRQGRNPQTGAALTIKASKSVRFKASPGLKKSI